MFKYIKKQWKYFVAKISGQAEANRDLKVQLEQAIGEAHSQHKRLKEQAANVIAGQKQAEIRLNKKMEELEKLNANARQALIMAADAEKAGNADKATQYTGAAATIANQLIQVERDVISTPLRDSSLASGRSWRSAVVRRTPSCVTVSTGCCRRVSLWCMDPVARCVSRLRGLSMPQSRLRGVRV